MSIARIASVLGLLALGVMACSEAGFDPRSVAEQGIRDQIMIELDLESEVVCTEPADTAVGTTFTCEATDADGKVYRFVAEILPDEIVGTRLARV